MSERFSDFAYTSTNGTVAQKDKDRWEQHGFNVLDFMPYGATDSGDSVSGVDVGSYIQAANDYLWTYDSGIRIRRTLYFPAGFYKHTLPLFADPPGNLRGSATAWSSGTTYASGNVVTYAGIPWVSQASSNTNHTPILPHKYREGTSYAINDILEFNSLYWICISGVFAAFDHSNRPDVDTTHFSPFTIWWRPTTVEASIFSHSLAWIGEEGRGSSGNGHGVQFRPTYNNDVGIWIGTGQGNLVKNITMQGRESSITAYGHRKGMPVTGCGIAIAGGNAGASRTDVEECEVSNFHHLIRTGFNQDILADSNIIKKCNLLNGGYGVYIGATQNFINSVENCTISCNTAVFANHGQGCKISDGNHSAVTAVSNSFSISSVSSITSTASGNDYIYTFTATVASPDDYLKLGIYDAFTLVTAKFGVVPCRMTAFNTSTNVASFQILKAWGFFHFPASDAVATSDLQAQIQAVTTLYAAEMVTVWSGTGFAVDNVHIENASAAPTTLFDTTLSGQGRCSTADMIFNDYDPALPAYAPANSPTPAQLAQFYAQAVFPWLNLGSDGLVMSNCTPRTETSPLIIDLESQGAANTSNALVVRNTPALRANIRLGENGGFVNDYLSINAPALGAGDFDGTISVSNPGGTMPFSDGYRTQGMGRSPFWGVRPVPWSRPVITPSHLTTLGSLPSITFSSPNFTINYPLLWGGQIYGIYDWYTGSQANYQCISNHHFYTLGQDLTTTSVPNLAWSYKGQSFAVYANDEALRIVFPGLGVILNDGTSDVLYIVTGIYRTLGYFTVAGAQSATDTSRLSGVKTSTKTGTVIKQEPFAITPF